ncbi:MAG: trigger factor [Chloroflexi bacterium]|nr:trigger factor [Chloroflexota bacterium]
MNITTEPIEPRQVKLTVEVPEARLTRAMEQVGRELSKRYKVPGYRPGKVPLKRMIALLGEEGIRQEAIEALGREIMAEAMQETGSLPAAPVQVEVASESPLTFSALVPLTPLVDLDDYRALRLPEAEPPPVDASDVDALLERLRRDLAQLAPVDRPAEAEDVVELSLTARRAVAVAGDEAPLLQHEQIWITLDEEGAGRAGLPAAVIDELIGLSAKGSHRFTVTYPEDWSDASLGGRPVAFEARVNTVSRLELPELDDAFAQQVSDMDSLEALRRRAEEDIALRRRNEARDAHLEAVLDRLADQARLDYPPALLELELRELVGDLRERVERQGFEWKRWLELQEKSEETLWAELEAQAERQLRRSLVMQAFVEQEGIAVSEAEIRSEVERFNAIMASLPRAQRPDGDDLRRRTANRILTGRAIERLLDIAAGRVEADAADEASSDADGAAVADPTAETSA